MFDKESAMKESRREASLDGLRGLGACIIAFVWHYQHFGIAGDASPFYRFMPLSYTWGWLAVELFFMLSGFGLTAGYKNRILAHRLPFSDFMKRRLCRLYPLHLITLILVAILQWIHISMTGATFVYPNFDLHHFVLNIFCLQNGFFQTGWSFNAPSWCLSIFLILYSLFFTLMYTSKDRLGIIIKFAVAAVCGTIILQQQLERPVLNSLVARGLTSFSVGVLLFMLQERFIHGERPKQITGALCVGILAVFYPLLRYNGSAYAAHMQMLFIFLLAPTIAGGALYFRPLQRILCWKPLLFLGSISFEIYLLHFPAQCIIRILDISCGLNLNYASGVVWLLYASFVLLLAAACKTLVETTARKKRWNP